MNELAQHLIVLPILVPLLAGALLLVIDEPRHKLKASVSAAAVLLLLGVAALLVAIAWFTTRPRAVVLLPVALALLWLAVVLAGARYLGWSVP